MGKSVSREGHPPTLDGIVIGLCCRYREAWEDFVPRYAMSNRGASGVSVGRNGAVSFTEDRLGQVLKQWRCYVQAGTECGRISKAVHDANMRLYQEAVVDDLVIKPQFKPGSGKAQDASWVLIKKYQADDSLWVGKVLRVLWLKDYNQRIVHLLQVDLYRCLERKRQGDGCYMNQPSIDSFLGMPVFKDEVFKLGGVPHALIPLGHVAACSITTLPLLSDHEYRVVLCRDPVDMYISGGYQVPPFWR